MNKFEVALRVWRDVQGASVADIVERLRRMTYIGEAPAVYKGVDYATVWKFLRARPPFVFTAWQQLLQGRVKWYLVELKAKYLHMPTGGPTGKLYTPEVDLEVQGVLKQELWESYAVQCDFRSADLMHVWAHVCHRGQ